MLTTKSYTPILKWKRAEQGALKDLREDQKKDMIPLIEIVLPKVNDKKTADEAYADMVTTFKNDRVKEVPKEILQVWGEDPIFVDMSLIYPLDLKQLGMHQIVKNSLLLRLKVIPVFNLADEPAYQQTAIASSSEAGNGVCLRITVPELSDVAVLNTRIGNLISEHGLNPSNVDILIDVKETADELTYGRSVLNSQQLVHLNEWRSFIFANGTFPQDLTDYKKDDENSVPRSEWLNWKRQMASQKVLRKPTFADYTIRHPIYNETTLNFPGTASLKYTVGDEWYIMKGEVRRFDQYLGHAALLITQESFYGESFSAGDKYIKEKGLYFPEYIKAKGLDPNKAKGTGRAEDWIRAGINHHLSVAVDQLANLV